MKLYATITSERGKTAHKGGNDRLNVNINVNSDKPSYTVNLFRNETQGITKVEFLAYEFGKWQVKYATMHFENRPA